MNNVMLEDFFCDIDWPALRAQKAELLEQIGRTEDPTGNLSGLLHLIDGLQDVAVDSDFFAESEVFGWKGKNG